MTKVKVRLSDEFKGDAMNVYLCGKTAVLAAGTSAIFDCDNGRRRITVEILSPNTGLISYRLDFINAQRWNGNRYVKDKIYSGELKSFYVYVPGVQS